MHHTDGRAFLIALSPSPPLAVALDGVPLPLNKPTAMRKGSRISFEGAGAGGVGGEKVIVASFKFDCENSGTKRERGDSGDGAAAAAAAGPSTVRASHLLVKHAGSRRPSSWKEPVVTRSLDEARAIVSAFREGILSSSSSSSAQGAASSASSLSPSTLAAAFASLASVESHCSSARNGGDLGVFRRGQMQRTFEDAAFGLGVGEMSGLVESDSGEGKRKKKRRKREFSFSFSFSSLSFFHHLPLFSNDKEATQLFPFSK